jgi:hypothetical protein
MVAGLKRVAPNLTTLELLVITHIDIDHIDGIVTLLNRDTLPFTIKEVWFNGYDQIDEFGDVLGELQGEYMSRLIQARNLSLNTSFGGGPVLVEDYDQLPVIPLVDGMELTLLSPGSTALGRLHKEWKEEIKKYGDDPDFNKKLEEDARYESDDDILGDLTIEQLQNAQVSADKSAPNESSISFIATYKGKTCLFAADCTSDYLLKAIQPILDKNGKDRLKLDVWKLAHHGSKSSTLEKLMKKIDCKKLLVSTNGANYKHPHPECIAKLLKHNGPNVRFYFNYKTEFNQRWSNTDEQNQFKFKTSYPTKSAGKGITLKLLS